MHESGNPGGGSIRSSSDNSLPWLLLDPSPRYITPLMPKLRVKLGSQYWKSKKTICRLRFVRKKNNVEVSTSANVEMDGHMEDIMHKEANQELVTTRGQSATNYKTREPRRSSKRRISNRSMDDSTMMKTMETEIKKLYQLLEGNAKAHHAEIACINENQNVTHASSSNWDHIHVANSSDEVHTAHHQPFPTGRMNLNLPRFDSSDALGWIFNVDQYFSFYQIPDEQQIAIAGMHMSSPTIPWFQMQQRIMPFRSWNEMKCAIEIEFGPTLLNHHTSIVSEYYTKFITLANRTNIEPIEFLHDYLISGLHMEIRREVKAQSPTSLMPPLFPTPPHTTQSHHNGTPIKRLTPTEQQIKRDKGLCYWCDEKFTPHHKFLNKHFMLYQLEEVLEQPILHHEQTEMEEEDHKQMQQLENQVLEHHLSLSAMKGTPGSGIIRLKAFVHGMEVQVLIDGGSLANFIQPRIAKFLSASSPWILGHGGKF
ncbi:hypothetical protein V8G54_026517 [Vigna mungo]|uniref:Retrotransposon gag domain-containing protein n=1 Tax=Vigna mungo TaxID=3915 RepID=A0AAQ3N0M0_VIGMU